MSGKGKDREASLKLMMEGYYHASVKKKLDKEKPSLKVVIIANLVHDRGSSASQRVRLQFFWVSATKTFFFFGSRFRS